MSMDFASICKRAGGRRRYNRDRREAATLRRGAVVTLMDQGKSQAEIALALGVSQATISRDQHRLMLYFIIGRKKAQRLTERQVTHPWAYEARRMLPQRHPSW